ncbi:NAD-dependent epimerase/dehydratase family protein [Pedobacter miscanthi]|uniref:NAD-dependent epimerase/dehydratase domain-containing protein n=1 Tax=Pedobacter miscanthi TaxID=2259170 RepID=A0A366L9N5_9SPHI|nr:NAD-dependent epimerase/dehydratase family protein [Pedobacter miscanthi]RBQ10004.1 hypothetical protein DRW42_06085 [Pedobacter miscanthi]
MGDKKWLVLGGGAVFQEYYLKAFAHLGLLKSITVVELNENVCKLLSEKDISVIQMGFDEFFDQNNLKFDFAVITLPNYLHEPAIAHCLADNIAVLCEKPVALTTAACDRIIRLESQSAKHVYTGMVRRYMPSYQALSKSLALVGKINTVKVEDGNPYAWVADSYAFFDPKNGGVLADMGVHYLDLLYHLFDDLVPVNYQDDYEGGVEANTLYHLKNADNTHISLKLSRTEKLKNTFEIIGEKGRIWMEKDNFESCFFSPDEQVIHEIRLENAFADKTLKYIFEACFVEQLSRFASNHGSLVKMDEAKAVINLIEWAYNQRRTIALYENGSSFLITGGTGFIGTALIEKLWKDGVRNITAPVRGYKNCAPIARFGIALPKVDLLNYNAVEKALSGKKYLVHLAYSTDGKDAYNINIEATKNLVKAACKQGVEAIVILSTMNVYGFPNGMVDENTVHKPAGGTYGKTKKIMQQWCLDFAKSQHKTRIVLLNPTCVFGPNGKTYTTLPLVLAKSNRFCWIDDGQGLANVVYIDNLLDAILKALEVKAAHGKNFIINDGVMTWKDFLTPLLQGYGNKIESLTTKTLLSQNFKEKTSIKKIVRYLLANYEFVGLINQHPFFGKIKKNIFNLVPKFRNRLDGQREVEWLTIGSENLTDNSTAPFNPPVWLNEIYGNTQSTFLAEKAKEILGWKPTVDLDEAIKRTSTWLKKIN